MKKYLCLIQSFLFLLIFNLPAVCLSQPTTDRPPFQDGVIYLKIERSSDAKLSWTGENGAETNPREINEIFIEYGVTKIYKPFEVYNTPTFDRIYKVFYNETCIPERFISELERIAQIEYAEKVPRNYPDQTTPNDADGPPFLDLPYQLGLIRAYEAWDLHQGGSLIAIVDDAVLVTHEDLRDNFNDINGYNVVDDNDDPNPITSTMGHGTAMASIACGTTNNERGVASPGWNNQLMAIRTQNGGPFDIELAYDGVAEAAVREPDIINMSWGSSAYSLSNYHCLVEARSRGCILVSSAGNEGNADPRYPAAYGEGFADPMWELPNKNFVIAVASIDANGNKSSFSSFGSWVDVATYGANIPACTIESDNSYGTGNGTSQASALVSGVLGLMKSHAPTIASNDDIINCLFNSANPDIYLNNNPGTLGSGRVNAYNALRCLKQDCNAPYAYY